MHKDLVYSINDKEFLKLASKSNSLTDLAKKLGFKFTPGFNSKKRIKERFERLNAKLKEKEIIPLEKYNIPEGKGISKIKGDISELSVQIEFLKFGIKVSKPIGDNCPYDLIIDYKDKLYKIQIKTATQCKNGSYGAKLSSTYICKDKIYKNRKYTKKEVDIFAIHSIEESKTCYIFNDGEHDSFIFRTKEIKHHNNVNLYDNFSLEKLIPKL